MNKATETPTSPQQQPLTDRITRSTVEGRILWWVAQTVRPVVDDKVAA